jgi:methylmalonyl-CoA/ethylmalonyl-CoA epimerase
MRFHHIGLFVDSLERGVNEMSKIYEIEHVGGCIEDDAIGVKIIFLKDTSGIVYELVAPLGDASPVNGVLVRGHGFLNHLAYTTDQFDHELIRLRELRMMPLGPAKKAKAFNGRRVAFFLTTLRYIIEIIEEIE